VPCQHTIGDQPAGHTANTVREQHPVRQRRICAVARFPTPDGVVEYSGETAISGVPGAAAAVVLDVADTAGSAGRGGTSRRSGPDRLRIARCPQTRHGVHPDIHSQLGNCSTGSSSPDPASPAPCHSKSQCQLTAL
jgi:hypothetical protein